MNHSFDMKNLPDKERPWKPYASAGSPPTLVLHLSNGKQVALAWTILNQFQMDDLKGKEDFEPIGITLSIGRASYGIAICKQNAEQLWEEFTKKNLVFIRPIHPVIEIVKITSSQPE